jgi:hypothetical protein
VKQSDAAVHAAEHRKFQAAMPTSSTTVGRPPGELPLRGLLRAGVKKQYPCQRSGAAVACCTMLETWKRFADRRSRAGAAARDKLVHRHPPA